MNSPQEEQEENTRTYVITAVLVIMLILIVICGFLTLIGPQIGNVFSRLAECACLPG